MPLSEATAAKPQTRCFFDEVPAGNRLTAHTDGACSGNPGPGGWGVVFRFNGSVVGELSGSEPGTKNNRMELTAVREALRRVLACASLEIATDSKNVIGWLVEGWKRNEPTIASLCKEIDALRAERLAAQRGAVTFRHVRGHSGDPLNERADKLATGVIERLRGR